MKVVVHHRFVGNRVQKGSDHIRFARYNQHRRSIVDIHAAAKPEIGVVANSLFQIQKRFGCDLRGERVIAVKAEVWVLVDADQKRAEIGGHTIDQLWIVEMGGSEEERRRVLGSISTCKLVQRH